jgi:hypothetical protein
MQNGIDQDFEGGRKMITRLSLNSIRKKSFAIKKRRKQST